MTQFLTLIHSGGGSQVEAAHAQAVLGPWPDQSKADAVGAAFHDAIAQVDRYFRDEYFWTVVEIPDSTTDVKQQVQDLLDRHGYSAQVVTREEYAQMGKPALTNWLQPDPEHPENR